MLNEKFIFQWGSTHKQIPYHRDVLVEWDIRSDAYFPNMLHLDLDVCLSSLVHN